MPETLTDTLAKHLAGKKFGDFTICWNEDRKNIVVERDGNRDPITYEVGRFIRHLVENHLYHKRIEIPSKTPGILFDLEIQNHDMPSEISQLAEAISKQTGAGSHLARQIATDIATVSYDATNEFLRTPNKPELLR